VRVAARGFGGIIGKIAWEKLALSFQDGGRHRGRARSQVANGFPSLLMPFAYRPITTVLALVGG
jgi:hypothetical protein